MAKQARAGKDVVGRWINELNSILIIEHVDKDGNISGKYNSAAGNAEDFYALSGKLEPGLLDRSKGRPVGLTVVWKNDKMDACSVTTWSGQFYSLPDKDVLIANWLLTRCQDFKDAWEATIVGQDHFVKVPELK